MRALVLGTILALGACRGGSAFGESDASFEADAGDAGADAPHEPNTAILTSSPLPLPTPTDATLVFTRQEGELEWKVLTAKSAGTYVFAAKERWTAIVVCANETESHVALFERTNATKTLEVTLDEYCLPLPTNPARKLSGTLSNIPVTSSWLDFAYAKSVRGSATAAGTSMSYEIENVHDGTWDIAFGVRDDAAQPLTRIAIRRGEVVNADKQLDLDLATAFPAGTKNLDVSGINLGDATTFTVAYAMNAEVGLDLGPQLIPDQERVATNYFTIPPNLVKENDRYRGHLIAQSDGNRVSREVLFSIHVPIEVMTGFPKPLPEAPIVSSLETEEHLGLETKVKVLPEAVRYEILALGKPNGKSTRIWSASVLSTSAVDGTIVHRMPKLTAVPGWNPAWELPKLRNIDVTVSAHEGATPLGDGTIERVSRHMVTYAY